MEQKTKGGARKGAGAKKLPYKSKLMHVPVELIPQVKQMRKEYKQLHKPARVSGNP